MKTHVKTKFESEDLSGDLKSAQTCSIINKVGVIAMDHLF